MSLRHCDTKSATDGQVASNNNFNLMETDMLTYTEFKKTLDGNQVIQNIAFSEMDEGVCIL